MRGNAKRLLGRETEQMSNAANARALSMQQGTCLREGRLTFFPGRFKRSSMSGTYGCGLRFLRWPRSETCDFCGAALPPETVAFQSLPGYADDNFSLHVHCVRTMCRDATDGALVASRLVEYYADRTSSENEFFGDRQACELLFQLFPDEEILSASDVDDA